MQRFFLIFFLCSNCTISRAREIVTPGDSSELHIRILEKNIGCRIPQLFNIPSSFDLISNTGAIKSFTVKNRDTTMRISSVYSIIAVPADGFIYGRKCYYKIEKENEVIIEDHVPMIQNENNLRNHIYNFWNLFYKKCPYYRVNSILFESNLNNVDNRKKLYNLRKTIYHQALAFLDSLKNSMDSQVDKDYFFLKQILKYEWLADCLLISQQVKAFYQTDSEFIKSIRDFDKIKDDSLINFPTYQVFLQNYLERVLLKDNRLQINTHGFTYRYYDAIDSLNRLPASFSKQYLIKYCLKKTEENFDSKIILQVISKVRTSADSSVQNLILAMEQRIKLRNQIEKSTNEFITIDSTLHSLQNILEANKGKILYVDIWASWCVPCRVAMVYSRKLREDFKNREITFIYFSVDEDFDKWKKASEQESLSLYPNSFKATNPLKNIFFAGLKVEEIPRYLLFDKSGKLVHSNAPGPDSEELNVLLQRYLKD